MLFSSDSVVKFINAQFEPVWESVRPVPIVRIDFGNGEVVTRTLHGNIATYACNADGHVLDVLPGIYEPQQYVAALHQLLLLHRWSQWQRGSTLAWRMKEYHSRQATALKEKRPPDVFVQRLDATKMEIESPIRLVAQFDKDGKRPFSVINAPTVKPSDDPKIREIAGWSVLAEDTKVNETTRREQIHTKLVAAGTVKPNDIKNWLYKEVLHADLDDPYLGLGKMLFADYPFAGEDAKAR